jgi:hypothetical protein
MWRRKSVTGKDTSSPQKFPANRENRWFWRTNDDFVLAAAVDDMAPCDWKWYKTKTKKTK